MFDLVISKPVVESSVPMEWLRKVGSLDEHFLSCIENLVDNHP
jgi:hypothetical protein